MFTSGSCPYCVMAEKLLRAKGVTEVEKVRGDLEPARRDEMMSRTGRRTVPQIYIGSRHVAATTTSRRSTAKANSIPCWPLEGCRPTNIQPKEAP